MHFWAFLDFSLLNILRNWSWVWILIVIACLWFFLSGQLRVLTIWKYALVIRLCGVLLNVLECHPNPCDPDLFFAQVAVEYTVVAALGFGINTIFWWARQKRPFKPDYQANLVVLHGWLLILLFYRIAVYFR